jgi:hypothetical protein
VKLTAESIEGLALSFQSIDDIHGGDGLPLGMLGVGDSIPDNIFEENFENTSGFFVDESRDTLNTTSSSKTTDSGFRDTLDIVTKNLTMSLGTSFSQTFTSLSTSRHDDGVDEIEIHTIKSAKK